MLSKITNKQIKLLKALAERSPVIARWDHADLSWLLNWGLVKAHKAFAPGGGVSGNVMWVLSSKGSAFLDDERGGQ